MTDKISGSSAQPASANSDRSRESDRADESFAEGLDFDSSDSSPRDEAAEDWDQGDESRGSSGGSGWNRGSARGEAGDGEPGVGRRRRRRRRRRRGGNGSTQEGQGGGHRGGQRGGHAQRGRTHAPRPRSAGQNGQEVTGTIEGVLELHPKGYGFLRDMKKDYAAQDTDAFVSSSLIEKHRLREGILIRGEVGPGTKQQGPRLLNIESIDGRTIEEYQQIKHFDDLTAINPFEQIRLETGPAPISMRVMDLLTPIGKGQRALIVAPPRTGKTILLQQIADAVSKNHPEVHLMVLLIDERPEEVTDMRRNVRGEVIASSMDREVESHIRTSQLIIERGKRIAEAGGEVFILLDSITRTARAFNKWVGNTGRTMSGGLDVKALDTPKKMFGTARRFDEGGSLTVVATALRGPATWKWSSAAIWPTGASGRPSTSPCRERGARRRSCPRT